MARLVIFGAGDIARLAHHYFTHDSPHEVAGFVVDRAYRSGDEFLGLPFADAEDVTQRFPPGEYAMFVAISYVHMNAVRAEKYATMKAAGYQLLSYVSSRCSYLSATPPGDNCFILEDNTIQPFVTIGNNVTLWSGNHIGHHSTIADHCFLASHVVVSGGVEIGEQCFVGVNVTLRDHVRIGARCVLGAGALLLQDAEPEGVYMGTGTERSRVPSSRLRGI